MKGPGIVALGVALTATLPILEGVGLRGVFAVPEPSLLVAQADGDVLSVADVYARYILPKYPNPSNENRLDDGFISVKKGYELYGLARVPRDSKLCQVLAALQGYTRRAKSQADLIQAIARLKRASTSGGYLPTVAGNPAIISDLTQLGLPTKLPSWKEIVAGSKAIAANELSYSSSAIFGELNVWDKLYSGLGSLRQIDGWLDEVYRPLVGVRERAGKRPK
jgi:hypothetical protein